MQHLVDRIRVRLAVGDDDALGVARCAGGVVDSQRVEFAVGRPLKLTRRLPGLVFSRLLGLGQEVCEVGEALRQVCGGVCSAVDGDGCDGGEFADERLDNWDVFGVDDEDPRTGVFEDEVDFCAGQADVQRHEHRTCQRYGKLGERHFEGVRRHVGHTVARADAEVSQKLGTVLGIGSELGESPRGLAVDNGCAVRVDAGAALKEAQRRKRCVQSSHSCDASRALLRLRLVRSHSFTARHT